MDLINNKTIEKLKYDLVRDELVTFDELEAAQEYASAKSVNVGSALINSGVISEEALLKFLEEKLHIPYVDLDGYEIDKKCLEFITFKEALNFKILPLFQIEDTLTVAMADPLDLFAIENIIERTGKVIEPVISSETGVLRKINEYYETTSKVQDIQLEQDADYDWQQELHATDLSEENLQKLLRSILKSAILKGVHELYFENAAAGAVIGGTEGAGSDDINSAPGGLSVNFKMNRAGYEVLNTGAIPALLVNPFVAKLKTLAGLDPTVSEIPQLGKLDFNVDNTVLTTSVSAFPTINGERISLKIYHPPKSVQELNLDPNKVAHLKKLLESSSQGGVILVCGSALSGKTHVIYSILSELIPKNKTVMTFESVVKYKIGGVHQCELNENVGFNLDKAMRFIEFQSPDIVYFEGIATKEGLDFFTSLTLKNKTLITEFLADNMDDLRKKFSYPEFSTFKSVLNCLIFIHNQNSIEIFDRENLRKYLL